MRVIDLMNSWGDTVWCVTVKEVLRLVPMYLMWCL